MQKKYPTWYKEAVIYQLHVRAYSDSNGDGIGDFCGLEEKLHYVKDFGATAIWLLPFFPSPLRDDGYDIADYTDVHPSYGTLHDFREFLKKAHQIGLKVIIELVLNHTSDQHPWFQRARKAERNSQERDYYVWSDTPNRYQDTRIIFTDFEKSNWTWDREANAYYWHRFYSHQPDLNFDSPVVHEELFRVLDFWLGMGVDGLRLDAVPYLYERDGTNCENLPETHAFLRKLRKYVDNKYSDRMLLAEANQWPEDSVAYFGQGDECHMAFHFPLMPRMFMAVQMNDRYPILDILKQTPAIPETCQWAIFLRNHDELTLEMVTDEERDYMYRMYAHDKRARINVGIRRRLAPLMRKNQRQIELLQGLLYSLPGTPIIYYGDEIGMGDNIYLGDRNGVRTPMQWSGDRNAGFSKANPQSLYFPVIIDPEYHYEFVNVESQQNNPNSFYWWLKRLTVLRKQHEAFSRGSLEFLEPENRSILTYFRKTEKTTILVVANLSRFTECVELNLSKYKGLVPVELFGGKAFPPIGELPYFVTLAPFWFYWFSLEERTLGDFKLPKDAPEIRTLEIKQDWQSFLTSGSDSLAEALKQYLPRCRWFASKSRIIKSIRLMDWIKITWGSEEAFLCLFQTHFQVGDAEIYQLPISFAQGELASRISNDSPKAVFAKVINREGKETGVLFDALVLPEFGLALLKQIGLGEQMRGGLGNLVFKHTTNFKKFSQLEKEVEKPHVLGSEQSNTSMLFGQQFVLKMIRKINEGVNPEVEVGNYLTVQHKFSHACPYAGCLEFEGEGTEPMTLGVLHGYVANQGDAWRFAVDTVAHFYEEILVTPESGRDIVPEIDKDILRISEAPLSDAIRQIIGPFLVSAELLGDRTAKMHVLLASEKEDPLFKPEPILGHHRRSLYQSMRNITEKIFESLEQVDKRGSKAICLSLVRELIKGRERICDKFRSLLDTPIQGMRIRCHGDFHLGQVLYTGNDFMIIDFEGEPLRTMGERKIKEPAIVDLAGMIRSFHYAAFFPLLNEKFRPEDIKQLEKWADFWYRCVASTFLRGYLSAVKGKEFLPEKTDQFRVLLDVYLLKKALYEVKYELDHRPTWVGLPACGVLELIGSESAFCLQGE